MKGISRERCIELAKKDVEVVRKNARALITICPGSPHFEFSQKEDYRLNILAVIGPTTGFNHDFEEAVLAEIGISRGRPYNEAKGVGFQKDQSFLPKRRKWFSLSDQQYLLIAQSVFKYILEEATKVVSKWNFGPWFLIRTPRRYWSHRQNRSFQSEKWREMPKGPRFTMSLRDTCLVDDIYWAELENNKHLIREFEGAAKAIDKSLRRYRLAKCKNSARKKPFHKLKGACWVAELIERFPSYQKAEILRYLPDGKRNYFYYDLMELFEILDYSESPERSAAKRALCLGDPASRLGNIRLRLINGHNNGRKKRDYVVFEVHPPWKPNNNFNPDEYLEENDDGFPF